MIFRQLFDYDTYTYTYLLGDEKNRHAVIIDPVVEQMDAYIRLFRELDLNLKVALDTHVHADHVTALGALREVTQCQTFLGNTGDVACASAGLSDGQVIKVGDIEITVLFTPGHTDDSYSFYLQEESLVFTGDTLLIRSSGRTDFQNGDANDLYESLHHKLLTLPEDTVVYPAHDYKGWSESTIGEEKRFNPRLLLKNKAEFVEHMKNLKLPSPKFMDVAVPANRQCGKA